MKSVAKYRRNIRWFLRTKRRKLLIGGGLLGVGGLGAWLYFRKPSTKLDLVTDVRHLSALERIPSKNPIPKIDTFVLHQMAVRDSYTGPYEWERWKKGEYHWVATEGQHSRAYLMNDLDDKLWTSNLFNHHSVAIEIEGVFEGYPGKGGYNNQPLTDLHPAQIEASKQAIRYTAKKLKEMGGELKYLAAHRQSSMTRRSDPGYLIWQKVAIPMMEELGLQESKTLENGRPIPEAWDKRNVGVPF